MQIKPQFLLNLKTKLSPQQHTSQTIARMFRIITILQRQKIDLQALAVQAKQGFPFEMNQLRKWSWMLMLKVLPPQKKLWQKAFQQMNDIYRDYVKDFIVIDKDYPIRINIKQPISKQIKSAFTLWQQIQKDTTRTHSQKTFFNNPTKNVPIPFLTNARKQRFKMILCSDDQQYRQFLQNKQLQRKNYMFDHMSRILFIWGNLNPKLRYIQGLNEVLAPIFYLFNYDRQKQQQILQVQVLLIFNVLISNIMDILISDFDDVTVGIKARSIKIINILNVICPQLFDKLQQIKATPTLFALRWLTMIFAQDLQIFDVMILWDYLIFSGNFNDNLDLLCVAVLICKKQQLLATDFCGAMQILRDIESIGLNNLINQVQFLKQHFQQHKNIKKEGNQFSKLMKYFF